MDGSRTGSGRPGRLGLVVLAALSFAPSSSAGQFPDLALQTLSGVKLEWPDELPAGGAMLIIVQDQGQQDQASSWLPFFAEIASQGKPDVPYFIVPVLPEGLLIVRSIVEQTIRMATSDPIMLERTVPLFIDIAAFQQNLGLSSVDDIQVAFLSEQGVLLAAVSGAYSEAGAQTLRSALENARSAYEPIEPVGTQNVVEDRE